MSTRSHIAYVDELGQVHAAYCHYDGYLDGVGDDLNSSEEYQNYDDVKKMVDGGPMRHPGNYFEDSNGEDDVEFFSTVQDFVDNVNNDVFIEYGYVFDDSRWYVTIADGTKKLHNLDYMLATTT